MAEFHRASVRGVQQRLLDVAFSKVELRAVKDETFKVQILLNQLRHEIGMLDREAHEIFVQLGHI